MMGIVAMMMMAGQVIVMRKSAKEIPPSVFHICLEKGLGWKIFITVLMMAPLMILIQKSMKTRFKGTVFWTR